MSLQTYKRKNQKCNKILFYKSSHYGRTPSTSLRYRRLALTRHRRHLAITKLRLSFLYALNFVRNKQQQQNPNPLSLFIVLEHAVLLSKHWSININCILYLFVFRYKKFILKYFFLPWRLVLVKNDMVPILFCCRYLTYHKGDQLSTFQYTPYHI